MKKPALPHPLAVDFLAAVKENIEILTGRRGSKISKLPATGATTDELAAKINELLDRLQQ